MTAPIAAATHAVVWIDHHHANVIQIEATSAQSRHVQAQVHPTSQHGSGVRTQHEFFADICSALERISAVLVTGGKTTLADVRHYTEKHRPQTAARIAAYEIVDHPTDKQLVALGRKFFEL